MPAFAQVLSARLAAIESDALPPAAVAFLAALRAAPPRGPAELRAMLPRMPSALAHDLVPLLLEPTRSLLPSLAAALGHPDPRFAHTAFQALTDRPRARALPLLVEAMRHHPDPDVRYGACYALAFTWPQRWPAVASQALLEAIVATADDPDEEPNIRGQALEGIANRFEPPLAPAVSDALLRALDDLHPTVRFWACFAAWQTRDVPCVERLRWLAAHDTARPPHLWRVAAEAADALGAFRDPPVHDEDHPLIPFGTWLPELPIRRRSPPFEPRLLIDDLRDTLLHLLQDAGRKFADLSPGSAAMNATSLLAVETASRTARVEDAPGLGGPPNVLGARLRLPAGAAGPVVAFLTAAGLEPECGAAGVLRGWYASGVRECLVRMEVCDD
jgi:hypothetical protein